MPAKVSSFDVFDTCLLRRCGAPSGVFTALAHVLQRKGILAEGDGNREDFIAARIRSESKARERASSEEVGLELIWRQVCEEMGWDYSDEFCRMELVAETGMLVANPDAVRLVDTARSKGCRLIFVSDMYLPADFIRNELERHGFFHQGDRLYVSSQVGLTKGTGKLFLHVLESEGIQAHELRHVGDHPDSDMKVPSSLGISAELYQAALHNPAERAAARSGATPLAETMRRFRLTGCSQAPDIHAFVSDFAGPFIYLFANWALQAAHDKGIKRLYFFARDCQLICKVAAHLAPLHGDIDCRYLKVSRQALFLPSAGSPSPEEMPWMFRDFEVPSLNSLLKKLELKASDWNKHFSELHGGSGSEFLVETPAQRALFWQLLNLDPLLGVIHENIRTRREAAIGYFQDSGMFDGTKAGVVDLGWFATCQMALVRILKNVGVADDLQGFYLGLQTGRYGPAETGEKAAMFYKSPEDSNSLSLEKQTVFDRATLIEHLIGAADHPSVIRYELATVSDGPGRYEPAYHGTPPDPEFVRPYHDLVLEFAKRFHEDGGVPRDEAGMKSALLEISHSFWSFPRSPAVEPLAGLLASSDQSGCRSVRIARPLTLVDIAATAIPRSRLLTRLAAKKSDLLWREGSLALSQPFVQRVIHILKATKRLGSQAGEPRQRR